MGRREDGEEGGWGGGRMGRREDGEEGGWGGREDWEGKEDGEEEDGEGGWGGREDGEGQSLQWKCNMESKGETGRGYRSGLRLLHTLTAMISLDELWKVLHLKDGSPVKYIPALLGGMCWHEREGLPVHCPPTAMAQNLQVLEILGRNLFPEGWREDGERGREGDGDEG